MEYYFYNTDNTDGAIQGTPGRYHVLIEKGFAATSGPRRFGEQFSRLRKDDVLLMYDNQTGVVAAGTVLRRWDGRAYKKPIYYRNQFEHEYRLRVDWFLDLSQKPLDLPELRKRIGSPSFTPRGAISQRIVLRRTRVEQLIRDLQARSGMPTLADDIKAVAGRETIQATMKETLINARVGQGEFRSRILRLWGHRCAVTGATTIDAIRASHIKPWCKSTNKERLDPRNGLPLIANLDALFDAGLISFDKSGVMMISDRVSGSERTIFGLHRRRLTLPPSVETAKYLAYHRKHVFQG